MRSFHLFLITLFLCCALTKSYGIPDEIGFLEQQLKKAKGTEKTDLLNQLAMLYLAYDVEKSLEYAEEAIKKSKNGKYPRGEAYASYIIGRYYIQKEEYRKADKHLSNASKLYLDLDIPIEAMRNYYYHGYSYMMRNRQRRALKNLEESLELATSLNDKEYKLMNYEALFDVNYSIGKHEIALEYFNKYINERDDQFLTEHEKTINKINQNFSQEMKEAQVEIDSLEYDKQVLTGEKEVLKVEKQILIDSVVHANQLLKIVTLEKDLSELKLRNERMLKTRYFILALGLGALSLVLLLFYRQKRRDNKIIAIEKARVEDLLRNILPSKVVDDLKERGESHPEDFGHVTVFFSDFVGFTELSTKMAPKELISELNKMFSEFDGIMERNGCERIKTIGDAYLAVCGMPQKNDQHVENILKAALEVRSYMEIHNLENEMQWTVRIGVHTGSVIGGIVGSKKYIYDVFGDTINTASRMESNSEADKINVSEETQSLSNQNFRFTDRGIKKVKGKGEMRMFYLEDRN